MIDVNLRELIDEIMGNLKEFVEKHKVDVAIDVPDDLVLDLDRQKMKEVFYNLLNNAIKYSAGKGDVSVLLNDTGEDDSVTVAITDGGIGIPPEDQPHIFEKFYRAGNAKDLVADGNGRIRPEKS